MDDDYGAVLAEREGWVDAEGPALRGVVVMWAEEDHLWVDNVAVDPAAQGMGVGAALLRIADRRASESGLPELRLLTHERMDSNLAIYEHLGWGEFQPEEREHPFLKYFRKRVSA